MIRTVYASALGALLLTAPAAQAGLLGTSVSGQMSINSNPLNYFDPANGFVPAGYGNSSPHGPNNVIISDTVIEFGFQDGANTDTADFTDTGGTLRDVSVSGSVPVTYTFTDTAFEGALLTILSDTFPNGGTSLTLVGDTLTIQTGEFLSSGTYEVTFSITPAPEPASLALLATAGAGVLGLTRRRGRRG